MRYRFGKHEFDSRRFELLCGEEGVPLRPRALSLLQLLLENRTRLVTKDEITTSIWGGMAISDSTIAVTLRALRRALGGDCEAIRTIYGKGMRFVGDVVAIPHDAITAGEGPQGEPGGPPEEGRPSIAVLPFRLVGVAGPHAALAEALPDDIITSLSQLRGLFVIARGSTFRFPSYDFRLATVGRELQVRYCLSGAMEIVGDQLRLSVELGETAGETVVWRENFDTRIKGAHELREELVYRLACELDRRIAEHEIERARLRNPADFDAWNYYHCGISKTYSHGWRDLDGALGDFEQAVALDPHFARGYAGLAHTRWLRTLQFPLEQRAGEVAGMLTAAERAEVLGPADPCVIAATGRAKWIIGDVDLAQERFERAIELAPSFAQAYANLGGLHALRREPEKSLAANSAAIALSPFDPNMHTWLGIQMGALAQLDRYEEAAEYADRALESQQSMLSTMAIALIAYHRTGDDEKGRELAARMRQSFPGVSAAEIGLRFPVVQAHSQAVEETFAVYGLGRA